MNLLRPSSPQLKVQDVLLGQVRTEKERAERALERMRLCLEQYNKLSRRFELLVSRKRIEVKKLEDYSIKERLVSVWRTLIKIFRRKS